MNWFFSKVFKKSCSVVFIRTIILSFHPVICLSDSRFPADGQFDARISNNLLSYFVSLNYYILLFSQWNLEYTYFILRKKLRLYKKTMMVRLKLRNNFFYCFYSCMHSLAVGVHATGLSKSQIDRFTNYSNSSIIVDGILFVNYL